MIDLLKIELRKILPYPTFWVVACIYIVLMPMIFYGIGQFKIENMPIDFKTVYMFPGVWNNLTYIASWFNLLLGIIVVILMGNEFNFTTLRQHIIDGLSKKQVIGAKTLLITVFALASTVLVFMLGITFGAVFTDESTASNILDQSWYLPVYFVQAMGYMSLALMLVIIIQKTALSMILFIFSIFIEWFIRLFIPDSIGIYFPMKIISNLTPVPLPEEVAVLQNGLPQVNGIPVEQSVGLALIYIVVFLSIGYRVLCKQDS